MNKPISIAIWMVVALVVFPTATLQAQPADGFVTVSGSATYRQRIAMPPDAVLTVRVEDVSRADAPAPVLAETSEPFGTRQVPIAFSLNVPSATIDPRFSYVLRATITVDGQLRFTTTRSYTVLTRGAPNHVDLLLDAVQSGPASSETPSAAPGSPPTPVTGVGFARPATFAGVMPCADCTGVAQTLTLHADGLYRLRRTYIDKPNGSFVELGRWTANERGKRLTLRSGSETILFEVKDDATLRLLDRLGQPITSNANLELRRTTQVDPISEPRHWRGEFRYMADSATFTDCASGIRWPVAMIADYLTVERNYLQSRSAPGAPLLMTFEGRIEVRPAMEGPPREQMVVDRFGGSQPGVTCVSAASEKGTVMAKLKDTYWKLIELDGAKVVMVPGQPREVRITLASEGSRLFGFSGCNQMVGAYLLEGRALQFTQMASTKMACMAPFMELESQVLKMLGAVSAYRIEGEELTLLGDDQILARFEAVYLR
jgi:uncharacterized lipoprotein YbaY/heat shock protein HslJ/uncharacterized lipoprotein NlpE involved in copper resistance